MRTNSAARRLAWSLPGRERPQKGTMTAESALTESAKAITMARNEPAAIAGGSIWVISVEILHRSAECE